MSDAYFLTQELFRDWRRIGRKCADLYAKTGRHDSL